MFKEHDFFSLSFLFVCLFCFRKITFFSLSQSFFHDERNQPGGGDLKAPVVGRKDCSYGQHLLQSSFPEFARAATNKESFGHRGSGT